MREELVCDPVNAATYVGRRRDGGHRCCSSAQAWFWGTSVVQVVALTACGPGGELFVVLASMFGHLTAEIRDVNGAGRDRDGLSVASQSRSH